MPKNGRFQMMGRKWAPIQEEGVPREIFSRGGMLFGGCGREGKFGGAVQAQGRVFKSCVWIELMAEAGGLSEERGGLRVSLFTRD